MFYKRELKNFEIAMKASQMSDYKKQHIGTVLVCGTQIISVGFNTNKTHPLQQWYNKYRVLGGNKVQHKMHSEVLAFIKVRHFEIDWSKVELYNYRIKADGSLGNSRPCLSCMAMIKDLGIKKIYYTTDDGYVKEFIKHVAEEPA